MTVNRSRMAGGGGRRGLHAGLALAGAALLALTFALGVLVGRQWMRPAGVAPVAEGPRKPTPAARRSALVDAEPERSREAQQKLTFYQTLTAPLGPAVSYPKSPAGADDAKAKTAPPRERAALAGASGAVGPRPEPAPARSEPPSIPVKSAVDESPRVAPAAAPETASWTVQVGVFGTRQPADVLERQLRGAGFEAYVTTLGAADGQMRFRVRVGSFRSRAEAERIAERVRTERALPTYVATN